MRTFFWNSIRYLLSVKRKLSRSIRYLLNSNISKYCLALIIGIASYSIPIVLIGLGILINHDGKQAFKVILISIIGILYSFIFINNIAKIGTNNIDNEFVIISQYRDYYEGYSMSNNTIVRIYSEEDLNLFSEVNVEGEFKVSKTNPYYSLSKNSILSISPKEINVLTNGVPFITDIKDYITQNLDYSLTKSAADFAKSLIFGDSSLVEKDVKEDFREIGILHVIALSGYNFILILGLVNSSLFFIDVRKRGLISIPFGILYLLIAGITNMSGLRALLFFILNTVFTYHGIYVSKAKLILITLVIFLVLNPLNVYSLSLVLSYSAYLGIITASSFKGNVIKKLLLEQVTVALFTLPSLVVISTSFNLLSILINIVLSPLVSLLSLVLVIAQILTPLLSLCDAAIRLVLKLTSNLSKISVMISPAIFLLTLLFLMFMLAKIFKISRI